jgi:hypothetical protein
MVGLPAIASIIERAGHMEGYRLAVPGRGPPICDLEEVSRVNNVLARQASEPSVDLPWLAANLLLQHRQDLPYNIKSSR